MIKKQKIEFIFTILMVSVGYLVVFTDIDLKWKMLCLAIYGKSF